MRPAEPVNNRGCVIVPEAECITYAKDQPEYFPIPVLRLPDGQTASRWRLTWRERLRALFFGDIYLSVLTFNRPLQPIALSTELFEEFIDVSSPGINRSCPDYFQMPDPVQVPQPPMPEPPVMCASEFQHCRCILEAGHAGRHRDRSDISSISWTTADASRRDPPAPGKSPNEWSR